MIAAATKSGGCGDLRSWSPRASCDFEGNPQKSLAASDFFAAGEAKNPAISAAESLRAHLQPPWSLRFCDAIFVPLSLGGASRKTSFAYALSLHGTRCHPPPRGCLSKFSSAWATILMVGRLRLPCRYRPYGRQAISVSLGWFCFVICVHTRGKSLLPPQNGGHMLAQRSQYNNFAASVSAPRTAADSNLCGKLLPT